MGFPDLFEIRRALRYSKNDLSEAVSILTNEAPLSSYGTIGDLSIDIDMKNSPEQSEQSSSNKSLEFPVSNLYELDSRVFQDNWSIPYKREESLGKCLIAAKKLAKEGNDTIVIYFKIQLRLIVGFFGRRGQRIRA